MMRVLVTDNLSPAGLKLLEEAEGIELDVRTGLSPEEVRAALREADGIVIRSGTKLTAEILNGQERLRAIVRAGVGVDNIDLDAATREGIVVMNTPAGNTTSTAEHTIAMMMALSRNIGPAWESMHAGKWERKKLTGTQVAGKTLAVIGLGRIGRAVAERARGLEMNVIGYDPFLTSERASDYGIELFRNLDEIVKQCDYLTVHTPLTDETRGCINAERIAAMKPGVRIINCARGGIIDEEALADAIESGHVAGAALDVFVSEPPDFSSRLLQLPRVLTTPHLGASTDEAQEMVAVEAAEIMTGFLLRGEVRHAVNMLPISAAEMEDVRQSLDLAYRLGLLLSQQHTGLKSARIHYRGEVASKQTKLITSAFTTGLLRTAFDENVNIVNAIVLAGEHGIEISETSSSDVGAFSSLMSATIVTDANEEISAAGTMFGNEFLRLVRLGEFQLDAYLDGLLVIYRHRDVPGLIGFIGSVFGEHNVNIAHMALGRLTQEAGGEAIAVLNVDNEPPPEALEKIAAHQDVTAVDVVRLPKAGAPLPWSVGGA